MRARAVLSTLKGEFERTYSMKRLLLLALCAIITACTSQAPNVKQRWNRNLAAYSFQPIYPPRSDVDIGDIRVHLDRGGSQTFDSRLLWDRSDLGHVFSGGAPGTAFLPGVQVTNIGTLNIPPTGLLSLLSQIFGETVEYSSALHIVLQDLRTAEVSDIGAVSKFKEFVRKKLQNKTVRQDICAAAITLGARKDLKDLRISMVTRTVSATKIGYISGEQLSNVPGAAAKLLAEKPNVADLKSAVVVGVDAVMLIPIRLYEDLTEDCKTVRDYIAPANTQVAVGRREAP